MQIYLKVGANYGLSKALQILDIEDSFIWIPEEFSKPTHIQASLAKINKIRNKKGLESIRIKQKRIVFLDPVTAQSEVCFIVERVS